MPTLGHGSDLSLAPTLGPWVRAGGMPVRAGLSAVAAAGFTSVQLDASLPGIRPRELDTGARRDLSASAGRAGLTLAGIDLFIPREHLLSPAHLDRATQALLAAVGLAGDLGRVPLSVALPVAEMDADVGAVLVGAADRAGVRLAVHAEDEPEALSAWAEASAGIAGIGMDPAAHLAARRDPSAIVQQSLDLLAVARLNDTHMGLTDGSRLPVGVGDLDLVGYRVGCDLAPRRVGPVVLDLRGLTDPAAAAVSGKQAWDNASVSF